MNIIPQKFPDLVFEGRRLIWDSRQVSDGRPEWVLCPADRYSNLEIENVLKARTGAWVVGPLGSSAHRQVKNPRKFLGEAAASVLGQPSSNLKILAVTGTNGKTTCATLMRVLSAADGRKVAELGTLGLRIFENSRCIHSIETGFTTPDAPTLHKLIYDLRIEGITCLVMEVSSHSIELARIAGVEFDGALFTNLTQEHLDFHLNMQEYENAKTRLFTEFLNQRGSENGIALKASGKNPVAVINGQDAAGMRIISKIPLGLRALSFVAGKNYSVIESNLKGLTVNVEGEELRSLLVGSYNAENIVGSWLLVREVIRGATEDDLTALRVRALAQYSGAPGRLERVDVDDAPRPRLVFVDYAHTPDALDKVLQVLKDLLPNKSRLFVVFGCGGDRDKGKRPIMGAIAQRLADQIYVTSDNPRTENPLEIVRDIRSGFRPDTRENCVCIEDRKAAIHTCLADMDATDVAVIAGKGHEDYQIVGHERRPFSDFAVVHEWCFSNS